jgi:hypothetical protein
MPEWNRCWVKITMSRTGGGGLRRVLVARLDSLGDVLLAGPAGRAVAASVWVTTRSRLGVSTLHSC